ncbi:LOW QUALITY PROTEIN: ras-specific guanine nucleotide-releasing factor 1 [Ciona intestinalis]
MNDYASCNDLPDKEGWLWKKGELNTSYQKRWCVLRGNLLFYFDKKIDRDPIGAIVLEESSVQLAEGGDSPYTFSIHFSGEESRVYKLTASNDDDCLGWIKALSNSSYRYLEILVEGLEKKLVRTPQTVNYEIQEEVSSVAGHMVTASLCGLELDENHFQISPKSNSLANLADSDNDLMNFDELSPKRERSPKLTRSASSDDFLKTNHLSVEGSKRGTSPKPGKRTIKLSPRLGRKKNGKSTTKTNVSNIETPFAQPTSYHTGKVFTFLEKHQQYRQEIIDFIEIIE